MQQQLYNYTEVTLTTSSADVWGTGPQGYTLIDRSTIHQQLYNYTEVTLTTSSADVWGTGPQGYALIDRSTIPSTVI